MTKTETADTAAKRITAAAQPVMDFRVHGANDPAQPTPVTRGVPLQPLPTCDQPVQPPVKLPA